MNSYLMDDVCDFPSEICSLLFSFRYSSYNQNLITNGCNTDSTLICEYHQLDSLFELRTFTSVSELLVGAIA